MNMVTDAPEPVILQGMTRMQQKGKGVVVYVTSESVFISQLAFSIVASSCHLTWFLLYQLAPYGRYLLKSNCFLLASNQLVFYSVFQHCVCLYI